MDRIQWVEASVLAPEEWRDHLEGCDAVIHAVAIDREHPEDGITYERFYRDSVEMLAWEAEHAGVPHVVCISSSTKPPFTSSRYLEAKREGEAHLRGRGFKESILRPGYVYSPDETTSMVAGGVLKTIVRTPGLAKRLQTYRPLRVEQVASAALRAATEPGFEGVIDIDNIAYLSDGHAQARTNGRARRQPSLRERVTLRRGALLAGTLAAAAIGGLVWNRTRRGH